MKNFTPSLLLFAFFTCAKAQAIAVPQNIKDSFQKHFPGAKAKWEKDDNKYEAHFLLNGKESSADFDLNGQLLETEIEVAVSELPAKAVEYMKTNYPGRQIKEVNKITDHNNKVSYEVEIKDLEVFFDQDGNFLRIADD